MVQLVASHYDLWRIIAFCAAVHVLIINNCVETKHRVRRKVVFTKNSKLFFRLNGKENVLNFTSIFAHGWSIRINYDLPESIPKRHKFFKRDVDFNLDDYSGLASFGINCFLQYMCKNYELLKYSEDCGIFCQILNIVNQSKGTEAEFFQLLFKRCSRLTTSECHFLSEDVFRTFTLI